MLSKFKIPAMQGLVLALGIGASTVGCSDRLPTYPVSGIVQFEAGKPVHVGTLELKSREHGIQARGEIQSDGSFQLTTYSAGDGAVAGLHDCVVVQMVFAEGLSAHRPSAVGVVDGRHASYSTSGLVVEVSADQNNELTIEVEGKRKTQPAQHAH
jgi:hypothetical protein